MCAYTHIASALATHPLQANLMRNICTPGYVTTCVWGAFPAVVGAQRAQSKSHEHFGQYGQDRLSTNCRTPRYTAQCLKSPHPSILQHAPTEQSHAQVKEKADIHLKASIESPTTAATTTRVYLRQSRAPPHPEKTPPQGSLAPRFLSFCAKDHVSPPDSSSVSCTDLNSPPTRMNVWNILMQG